MAAEIVEVVEMGWWTRWLGDGSIPELELVEGDGDLPAEDGEGDGPPAYSGGSAAGGQSPASAGNKEESDEDLIDLPDLISDDELGFERLSTCGTM